MDITIATQLAIALALGIIIGLERGWATRTEPKEQGSGGVRNFGLVGLLGGLAALLADKWGMGILAVIFLGFSLLVATSYVLTAIQTQDYGTTTELALLITFVLGALVIRGLAIEAVAVAVVVTWLLKVKQELHQTLVLLKRQELIATLQLLLIAVVALPLLPNQDFGPWQAINPHAIGLLVLLVISISYVGYFAIRIWSEKVGLLLTGLLGGLASSTATTIAFSRMARKQKGDTTWLAIGIALAAATMSPRLLLEVTLVNATLAKQLVIPLVVLALVPLAAGLILFWKTPTQSNVALKISNPVELGTAFQYAGLLVVLSVLIHGAKAWFGEAGVYWLSAISGLADVDTVSIALARAVNGAMTISVASRGILIAVLMNTIMKIFLARLIGGVQLARRCGTILLGALGISCLTMLVT